MTSVKRRLDDYYEEIPPTAAAGRDEPISIPDSCDEDSDIDEPKIIAGPSRNVRPDHFTPSGPGGSRSSHVSRPQGPLHPKVSLTQNVQATVGRGGKLQYTVATSPEAGSYYAVQW